jgi:hypothetical protein
LEGLAINDFGLFYSHLVYFCPFGIFYGFYVGMQEYLFSRFGMLYEEKSGNPALELIA